MVSRGGRLFCRTLVLVALAFLPTASRARVPVSWVPSWTAAQQLLEGEAQISDERLTEATLRQSVRLSVGGSRIRIVLSNVAGHRPLIFAGVHVAMSGDPGTAAILPNSDHEVKFGGRSSITLAAGGTVVSDAIELPVLPLARLSISLYYAAVPAEQTGHLRSLSTSWLARGDQLGATTFATSVPVEHWFNLAAVQVEAPASHVIIAFGDSITDGSRSTPNSNTRWPDLLAERLQASASTRHWAVANAGIAGNQVLADGFGPSALSRFDRDVLSQPHARVVVLLEGINDLGQLARRAPAAELRRSIVSQIIEAYSQLISRAHARGLRIVGATLTPYVGSNYEPTPVDEQDRQAINAWIRTSRHFDAVIDWDAVVRDPDNPGLLKPELDSGDHIHPSAAGYRAMANAIPIADLVK